MPLLATLLSFLNIRGSGIFPARSNLVQHPVLARVNPVFGSTSLKHLWNSPHQPIWLLPFPRQLTRNVSARREITTGLLEVSLQRKHVITQHKKRDVLLPRPPGRHDSMTSHVSAVLGRLETRPPRVTSRYVTGPRRRVTRHQSPGS